MLRQPSLEAGRRPTLRQALRTAFFPLRPALLSRTSISALILGLGLTPVAWSQTESPNCMTQSAMTSRIRQSIADAAMSLMSAVKANDTSRVQGMSIPAITSNFDATTFLIHQTSAALANDTLNVTQVYQLDATKRKEGDTNPAEFSCALSGTESEVDFTIPGLPPGTYAFAIVEAAGDRPWLLPVLFQQEGTAWKLAGFYPHPRSAAGHDGLWYWTAARADAKAGKRWLAWVRYGLADQLLRPANFVTSTHLDKLRGERRTNAPGELAEGVSKETPLVIRAKDGTEFHITSLSTVVSSDDKSVDLLLRYAADAAADPTAARARNVAAATALLTAHPELREGFSGVSVFAEVQGQPPFATEHSLSEIH